jgi:protein-S-isoprenylcysteine O-methyltransferase Ste14
MNTLTLKIIFFIGLIASFIIRVPHQQKNKQNKITDNRKTSLEKLLLFCVFLGMLVTPLIYIFSPILSFADYSLPTWVNIFGICIYLTSMWLFWKSHHDLGQNWSPTLEVRESHTLITDGIYQKIRHPMYTSVFLWCVAQALLIPNYIAGLSGIISFVILYFLRIGNEEKMMLDQFGDAYREYMERTGRIIPKLFQS